MYRKPPPDINRLKEVYNYDPITGLFTRKKPWVQSKFKEPRPVGCRLKGGYLSISIDAKTWLAHRLAWFYMTNEWPEEVDHWDGIPSNNRFSNLRNGDRAKNNLNSAGWAQEKRRNKLPRGVYKYSACMRKFRAQIVVNRKQIHLGCFDTIEEAAKAYQNAAELHFGQFAFHKRKKVRQRPRLNIDHVCA
jgi:HNH endonuclease